MVAGQLQVGQRPGDGLQTSHGLAAPASRRQREEAGWRVDAGVAGEPERGRHDRQAARVLSRGAHAHPVDGGTSLSGVVDEHGQVGDPRQTDETVVGFAGVRGQYDELVGEREAEGTCAGDVERTPPRPEHAGVECGHSLRCPLQAVVQLEEEGRHLVVSEEAVVTVTAAGTNHAPPGTAQGLQGARVIAAGEKKVDVLHGPQAGDGVAGGHRRPLEDDGFQSDIGQGPYRQVHRPWNEQERLHAKRVRHAAENGATRTEFVASTGSIERAPEQGADPMGRGGADGSVEVRPSDKDTPDGGRIGSRAAGLPEQPCRRFGAGRGERSRTARPLWSRSPHCHDSGGTAVRHTPCGAHPLSFFTAVADAAVGRR